MARVLPLTLTQKRQSRLGMCRRPERSGSMNTKQLLAPVALIGVCLVGTSPAGAAAISFSEATDPITVTTDITTPIPVITTSSESASLSLGTVTGTPTLLFRRQMTNMGTMTGEGGGMGVSDILELDSFVSAGATVG